MNSEPKRPQPDPRVEKALRDYDTGKALDSLSEQQEWTPERLRKYINTGPLDLYSLAREINSCLAAERQRSKELLEDCEHYSEFIDKLEQKLAAESQRREQAEAEQVCDIVSVMDEAKSLRHQLAAEREKTKEIELRDSQRSTMGKMTIAEVEELRKQLLSALAAIEKAKSYDCNCPLHNTIFENINLSALHQHDAEVLNPLVEALETVYANCHTRNRKIISDALAKVKEDE